MKKLSIFTLLLLFAINTFAGDSHVLKGDRLLYGMDKLISGEEMSYSFPIPGISRTLIIRGNKDICEMEFETEALPSDYRNSTALYVIPVGIGAGISSPKINIDMFINGENSFSFSTKNTEDWEQKLSNGTTLSLEVLEIDGANDIRGFLYLRIPTKLIKAGEAQNIKFIAEDQGVATWFMVFKDKITPAIKAKLLCAIPRTGGVKKQKVFIDIIHFAPSESATIKVNNKTISKQTLKMGYNALSIDVDKVTQPTDITIDVITPSISKTEVLNIKPTKEWQLNFVQHSHTDIGYTRPQTDILAEQIRYIDYALDYCDITDDYPDDAKFRWTCEAAWAVEEYLQTRPKSQIERLKRRVKEGRIELAGMLYNFDELPDENSLAYSLKPFKEFKRAGLTCEMAMQNDVNGIGWCFADYFNTLGVKYLNMGTHGHRALICFDMPTLFRWQSPSGKEVLAYRAEHYNHGNFLGVEKDNFESFEIKVLEYLASLEAKDYPYDIAQAQFSGYMTDNSPPSTQACDNIKKWNEKYEYPKLRSAVPTEFFKAAEAKYSDQFPVIKGAWPDWWTDGFGAGAREAAVTRYAHTDIIAASTGIAMAQIMGSETPRDIQSKLDETLRSILFFDEHTVGYSESVRDPYCRQTMEQRALKESYAWEAHRRARIVGETMQGLLQDYVTKGENSSIVIYNPLSWSRSGTAKVYIDHEVLPINKRAIIVDKDGNEIKKQPQDSRSDGTSWNLWVEDIPALGSKQYFIKILDESDDGSKWDLSDTSNTIEASNEWYNIEIDREKGTVKSIFDKELNREILDSKSQYGLGEFIHEQLAERSSMEAYRMGKHTREPLDSIWFGGVQKGEIYDTYRFYANTKTAIDLVGKANYTYDIKLYHVDKRIELGFSIYKKLITDPESFYIAMPFELEGGKIFCEVPGGVMEAGVDQIPGSSNDWNTVQNFAAVRSDDAQIVVVSNEIPLMQFGDINTGRYDREAKPETNHIFSWPMNNYWVTNFNADQRGQFEWSYLITSQSSPKNSVATKFGWGNRVPLVGRVLPKAIDGSKGSTFGSVLDLGAENILLVNMQPIEGENSVLVHIRETDGVATPLNVKSDFHKTLTLKECNVIGEEIGSTPTELKPLESKFIKVCW